MTKKAYNYLVMISGVICTYVMIKSLFFIQIRLVRTDVIQGILVGFGLAIATAYITAKIKSTKVNGWITMFGCGAPGNGMLLRAACALAFPGPINIPQEAMYWTTSVDGASHELSGAHDYFGRLLWATRRIALWRIQSIGIACLIGQDLYPTPTDLSTCIYRIPLRKVGNQTGCLRPRANLFSGYAYICPAKQF